MQGDDETRISRGIREVIEAAAHSRQAYAAAAENNRASFASNARQSRMLTA